MPTPKSVRLAIELIDGTTSATPAAGSKLSVDVCGTGGRGTDWPAGTGRGPYCSSTVCTPGLLIARRMRSTEFDNDTPRP